MLIQDLTHLETASDNIEGAFSRADAYSDADAYGAARAETYTYTYTYAESFEGFKVAYSSSDAYSEANV